MRRLITAGALICACIFSAEGAAGDKRKKIEQELSGVPRLELPAKVAEIVRRTPLNERSEAAAIAVETVTRKFPAAADAVTAAATQASVESRASLAQLSNGKGNNGNGNANGNPNPNGNGNAGGNGGVGHGPGPNKPGKVIIDDKPIKNVLPNGKPRHFPPDPPRRPVDPPRPIKYNSPRGN